VPTLYFISFTTQPRNADPVTEPGWRYCTVCNILRSPEVKHCTVCQNCVVGFDHHCPYTSNCIGTLFESEFVLCVLMSAQRLWGYSAFTQCFAL
jgi:hypothetical protein